MDFTKHLDIWASGDALQGRIMLGSGIILLIGIFLIFQSNDLFFKGMIIPLSLLTFTCLAYGAYLSFSRPKHLISTAKQFTRNNTETIEKEIKKALGDNKNYTILEPIWIVLMLVSIILIFIFTSDYYKGFAVGLVCLFIGFFLVDFFLHRRLKPYLKILKESTNKNKI